jgi:hypothetical protein
MNNSDLFKKLNRLNPTEEQLHQYMEIKKGIYPLPLFVQLPDKTYTIVRRLSDTMDVKGIVTERGVFLFERITPDKRKSYRYGDLLTLAQHIHPKAHPITHDDAYGEGQNIADLIDEDSPLYMTEQMLIKKRGIKPFGFEWTYFENSNPEQTSIVLTDIVASSETFPISYADSIPLFIPVSELEYDFKVVSKEPQPEKHGLDIGLGIDGCKFPPTQNEQEKSEFPLSLFLRDSNGKYFVRNKIVDGCTVEGVALRDTIILRQTITPCEIDKDEPTRADLFELAKQVHPYAQPLYFAGFPHGGGIITLLLLDKKRYNQTSELLKKYGVTMPDINKTLYFIGGDFPQENFVNQIYVKWWAGGSRIKCVEEMILAIPREKIDPLNH